VESLRARYTRDLSRYRVPILPQSYAANWRAWDEMLAATKAAGIPTLVYIAPRPTDFYPFDPAGYDAFKRDMERLARRQEAAFANFENVVPNNMWGLVDISFGFYARDPFHFTAEGHALFGRAMVPEIRRSLLRDARPQ
jgi:lysophospholipase L1-like esterase